ncbi:MAG: HepT-like ribonuclease domain-containing protein [Chloroflexota bacterium]
MAEAKGPENSRTRGVKPERQSRRIIEDYLDDALDAIAKIERYTAGVTVEQFLADDEKQDAVSRRLQVIGEAAKYIPKTMRDRHPEIPWAAIVGMHNVLTHAYQDEDPTLLWRTVQSRLSPLKAAVEDLRDRVVETQGD